MRAIGWTSDEGGCGFYRIHEPLRGLGTLGWDTHVTPQLDLEDGCHVLLTQRMHEPEPVRTFQAMARSNRMLCVADLDDDLWRVPRSAPGWDYWSNVGRQERLREWLRSAHLITVSTEPLAARVREEIGDVAVYVVPNTVPEELLSWPMPKAPAGEPVRIGWSGSDTHDEDWKALLKPVQQLLHEGETAFRFGGWIPPGLRQFFPERLEFVPWTAPGEPYYRTLRGTHVGLAPLVPSGLNDSKSAIKLLEYSALGIPWVASRVGPYEVFGRESDAGFPVSSPGAARYALDMLLGSPALRARLGEAGRRYAAQFTTETRAPDLDVLYRTHLKELRAAA